MWKDVFSIWRNYLMKKLDKKLFFEILNVEEEFVIL